MRGRTPIQSAIRRVLEKATTVEPYPVHVGWVKLTQDVYGIRNPYDSDIRNIQRAVERMDDVEVSYFKGRRKRSGAFLSPTPAQRWLKNRIRRSVPGTTFLVEDEGYRPATKQDILQVFIDGCHEENLDLSLLPQITALVNRSCGTRIDPSEVAWWRVGLESERQKKRDALLASLHRSLVKLFAEREHQEIEARKVTFGPIVFDPISVTECPCCHQSVTPGTFPNQRQPFQELRQASE
ncbi:hypothetical protein [Streptomyces cinereoruber]|uniref:hypothetical protein n=1 Tax=Streptomyces cinereoruber TaxID=67260 RepID=UPI003639012D